MTSDPFSETYTWTKVDCDEVVSAPRSRRRHISLLSDDGDKLYIYGGATPMDESDKLFNSLFRNFQGNPPSFLCHNGEVR